MIHIKTVDIVIRIPEEVYIHLLSRYKYQEMNDIGLSESEKIGVAVKNGIILSKGYDRLTNKDWINFLCKQFNISRTSAKDMLHIMMSVKREDNFKKQFSNKKRV